MISNIIKNYIFYLIPIICIFFSISYSIPQDSIDAALVQGNFINNNFDHQSYNGVLSSQFSLLIPIQIYLLKLGLSVIIISQIILFFSVLMSFIGMYLMIKSIIRKAVDLRYAKLISFIFTYISIFVIGLNLGMGDYPVAIFGENTFGIYSASMPTFIFGLLANGNIFFAFFFSFILLSVHGVAGLWILGILTSTSIIYRYYFKNFFSPKYSIIGSIIGFLVFATYVLFMNNTHSIDLYGISGFDLKILNYWDLYWETHRYIKEINHLYVFKSILLIVLLIFFLRFNKKYLDKKILFTLLSIILSIFFGLILYIFYKIFLEFLPPFIKAPISSRVFNTHSLIGWPIIFSISIIMLKEFSIKTKIEFKKLFFIVYFLLTLIIVNYNSKNLFNYIFAHYNKEEGIKSVLKNNPFKTRIMMFYHHTFYNKIDTKDFNFWNKIKNYDDKNYWIVVSPHHKDLARLGRKPILIDPNSFDFTYMSNSHLIFVKDIIENVYNIPFNEPPEPPLKTYHGRVPNHLVKIEFENKNYKNWLDISNKYNVKYVLTPTSWNIDLQIEFSSTDGLTLYKIN